MVNSIFKPVRAKLLHREKPHTLVFEIYSESGKVLIMLADSHYFVFDSVEEAVKFVYNNFAL